MVGSKPGQWANTIKVKTILNINYVFYSEEICQPGLAWNGTACVNCSVDMFKSVEGNNVSCQSCPANETTNGQLGASKCGEFDVKCMIYDWLT